MGQPSDSHLIANEVERLKLLPRFDAWCDLSERIAHTFQLAPPAGSSLEFKAGLDFNARLVTLLRNRGVIWMQSR